jgi:trigger factor
MVEQEFSQIWQRLEADRKAGTLDADDKDKDEEALKSEYRAIAERRVRLGLLLAEIGRVNSITVGQDEMTRAMRMEAMRYPGQEQKVFEFFRQNPRATDSLRGPLFEEKVVDFVLELAKVDESVATPEELAQADENTAAPAGLAKGDDNAAVLEEPAKIDESAVVPEELPRVAENTAPPEGLTSEPPARE